MFILLFDLDILKKQEEFKKDFIVVLYLWHFG